MILKNLRNIKGFTIVDGLNKDHTAPFIVIEMIILHNFMALRIQ